MLYIIAEFSIVIVHYTRHQLTDFIAVLDAVEEICLEEWGGGG